VSSSRLTMHWRGVVRKWNSKFLADGRMISMRTKHLHRSMSVNDFRADGSLSATASNMKRLTDLDDEVWIEVEIVTAAAGVQPLTEKKKGKKHRKKNHDN
jgi:hypothetical protein